MTLLGIQKYPSGHSWQVGDRDVFVNELEGQSFGVLLPENIEKFVTQSQSSKLLRRKAITPTSMLDYIVLSRLEWFFGIPVNIYEFLKRFFDFSKMENQKY